MIARERGERGLDAIVLATGERLPITDDALLSFAIDPAGAQIVTGHDDGRILARSITGGTTRELLRLDAPVRRLDFDPEGGLVALPARGQGVYLERLDAPPRRFGEASHELTWCARGPDGRIAFGAASGHLGLDSLREGDPPLVFSGHRGAVNDGAFSADGALLASAADDGTVRIWRTDRAGEGTVLRAGEIQRLAFTPDARHLVTSGAEVKIWTVHTDDLAARACRYVVRDLDDAQWQEYFAREPRPLCAPKIVDR